MKGTWIKRHFGTNMFIVLCRVMVLDGGNFHLKVIVCPLENRLIKDLNKFNDQ
jgi:hypothetical protein